MTWRMFPSLRRWVGRCRLYLNVEMFQTVRQRLLKMCDCEGSNSLGYPRRLRRSQGELRRYAAIDRAELRSNLRRCRVNEYNLYNLPRSAHCLVLLRMREAAIQRKSRPRPASTAPASQAGPRVDTRPPSCPAGCAPMHAHKLPAKTNFPPLQNTSHESSSGTRVQ